MTTGLVVTDLSPDTWLFTLPPGAGIRVTMTSDPLQADVDLTLYGEVSCTSNDFLDGASTVSAVERVSYVNGPGMQRDVYLSVWMFSGTCSDYSLEVDLIPNQCSPGTDDGFEPNDSCGAAVAPGASPMTGLFVRDTDRDYFAFVIPPETEFSVTASEAAEAGGLTLRLIDGGNCASTIVSAFSFVGDPLLIWTNNTPNARAVVLEVTVGPGGLFPCIEDYTLDWSLGPGECTAFPPDSFDPNESCATASPLTPGNYTGLTVRRPLVDEDWYRLAVPANSSVEIDALFTTSAGDVDLELFLGCGLLLVDSGDSVTDNESVSYSNLTASPVDVFLHAFLWPGSATSCTNYDLVIDVQPIGTDFDAFCFGDGSGTPCPCNNNSSPGHEGGCGHGAGDGAILLPSGDPSVTSDGLTFDLVSASPSTFGLLVSGDNRLPQVGGCMGCGLPAFDGLRCAGGAFLRHGIRTIVSNGSTLNPWGGPSGPSLIAQGGFVAGQSRSFFVFFRTNPSTGCGAGQNSSNGVTVTFAP